MEDASERGANTDTGKHVAELGYCRVRDALFEVALQQTQDAGGQRSSYPDNGDRLADLWGERQQRVRPSQDVNACRDHRGGMDQRADGCWASHGIRKPEVERSLGRLG